MASKRDLAKQALGKLEKGVLDNISNASAEDLKTRMAKPAVTELAAILDVQLPKSMTKKDIADFLIELRRSAGAIMQQGGTAGQSDAGGTTAAPVQEPVAQIAAPVAKESVRMSDGEFFNTIEEMSKTYLSFGATGASLEASLEFLKRYDIRVRLAIGKLCVGILLKPKSFLIAGKVAGGSRQIEGMTGISTDLLDFVPRHTAEAMKSIAEKRDGLVVNWIYLAKRENKTAWLSVNWTSCFNIAFVYLHLTQLGLISKTISHGLPPLPWSEVSMSEVVEGKTGEILLDRCNRYMSLLRALCKKQGTTENALLLGVIQ